MEEGQEAVKSNHCQPVCLVVAEEVARHHLGRWQEVAVVALQEVVARHTLLESLALQLLFEGLDFASVGLFLQELQMAWKSVCH